MEQTTILHIKNMVCPRCIKVVSDELKDLNFAIQTIQLGRVELKASPTADELNDIKMILEKNGFELLDDKKSRIVEKIKVLIIEGIRNGKFIDMHINLSKYISDQVQMEYTHLSTLFSSTEGKSIERFVILQKIERIKELITYDELSIKEIAHSMGYSSIQALSSQFKKETGMTPTDFKKLTGGTDRKSISEV
ncbi:MAG: helix-turn-helix transcriptional regulator [Cytophagaceae bacterium]|nr:helix-turn-helix transcriptional regulator [Cytophagaceae bacterium]